MRQTMRAILRQSNHPAILAPLALLLVALAAWQLHDMGRTWVCPCGTVQLWHGTVLSPENSQHLTDWYTFSHLIHGLLFYGLLHALNRVSQRNVPVGPRFLVAIVIECAWELIENAPAMIDRYRQTALAMGYNGDSIVNSVADIGAMALGFLLAACLPVRVSITVVLLLELGVASVIRDNLTLNILNLVYPLPVIQQWQQG